MKRKRLVIVGRIPPPPGGVGASILSVVSAFQQDQSMKVEFLKSTQLWKLFWILPDVVHYNFSMPGKRLMGAILGRIVGAKVIHTVHGNTFGYADRYNS